MTELARQADSGSGSQSMASHAQEKVQEKAQEVRGQVSSRVREQVDTRSTQAGDQVTSLAEAMRRTGQTLRDEGNDTPAKVTDAVAERADRLGSYLRDADGDAILRDVENLARRQPWLFAVGGLVLGVVASRFLKASSGRRYESSNVGSAQRFRSQSEPDAEVVFEPDVELDTPVGARHGA